MAQTDSTCTLITKERGASHRVFWLALAFFPCQDMESPRFRAHFISLKRAKLGTLWVIGNQRKNSKMSRRHTVEPKVLALGSLNSWRSVYQSAFQSPQISECDEDKVYPALRRIAQLKTGPKVLDHWFSGLVHYLPRQLNSHFQLLLRGPITHRPDTKDTVNPLEKYI